jgi:hypothetical protein
MIPSRLRLTSLDAAVLAAYGFSAKKDLLAQLLELNQSVAQRIETAAPVTPPGLPAAFPKPETLTSGAKPPPSHPMRLASH